MFVDEYNPSYRSQYERIIRWLKKFEDIDFNFQNKLDEYLDIAYAFFMNCYHQKDWIINDPAAGISSKDVEEYINSDETLKICADICNGLKHLRLDRPRSEKKPKIGVDSFYDNDLTGEMYRRDFFYIETTNGTVDPIEIANRCMVSWQLFMEACDLL